MDFDKDKIEELTKKLLEEISYNKGLELRIINELMSHIDKMTIKEILEFYKRLIEHKAVTTDMLSKLLEVAKRSDKMKKDLEDE